MTDPTALILLTILWVLLAPGQRMRTLGWVRELWRRRHHNQIKTHCPKHGIEYDVVWMKKGRPERRCSQCIALNRERSRATQLATSSSS